MKNSKLARKEDLVNEKMLSSFEVNMCNIQCQLCRDYDGCEIRLGQIYKFKVYVDNKFVCYTMATREETQSFTFLYPDYTLVLDTNSFDNDLNDEDLI